MPAAWNPWAKCTRCMASTGERERGGHDAHPLGSKELCSLLNADILATLEHFRSSKEYVEQFFCKIDQFNFFISNFSFFSLPPLLIFSKIHSVYSYLKWFSCKNCIKTCQRERVNKFSSLYNNFRCIMPSEQLMTGLILDFTRGWKTGEEP